MDELYRAFKIACRVSTHLVYARKIKANAKAIARRKLAIAQKLARGEVVSEQERGKVTSIVSLNPGDLGDILYGRLSDDGFAAINSPIAKAFTKEKILEAHRKVRRFTIEIYLKLVTQFCFFQLGFYPFTQAILKSKKLRHEIGQGEETDQTRMMRDLESEYNSLKETCRDEGKNLCLIFIFGDM